MAHCKHRVMDRCKKNEMPCTFEKHCFEPEETPEKTNNDRIRSMSDEELAEYAWKKFGCPKGKNHVTCGYVGECRDCWRDWLGQPEEEECPWQP